MVYSGYHNVYSYECWFLWFFLSGYALLSFPFYCIFISPNLIFSSTFLGQRAHQLTSLLLIIKIRMLQNCCRTIELQMRHCFLTFRQVVLIITYLSMLDISALSFVFGQCAFGFCLLWVVSIIFMWKISLWLVRQNLM